MVEADDPRFQWEKNPEPEPSRNHLPWRKNFPTHQNDSLSVYDRSQVSNQIKESN